MGCGSSTVKNSAVLLSEQTVENGGKNGEHENNTENEESGQKDSENEASKIDLIDTNIHDDSNDKEGSKEIDDDAALPAEETNADDNKELAKKADDTETDEEIVSKLVDRDSEAGFKQVKEGSAPPTETAESKNQVSPSTETAESKNQASPSTETAESKNQVPPSTETAESKNQVSPSTETAESKNQASDIAATNDDKHESLQLFRSVEKPTSKHWSPILEDWTTADQAAVTCPAPTGVHEITDYLKTCNLSESQLARAIFRWITDNITWETGGLQDPDSVLSRRTGQDHGFANLFNYMCSLCQLSSDMVRGQVKSSDYIPGSVPEPDYEFWWNLVVLEGRTHVVDCTRGAGTVRNGTFQRLFDDFYWLPQASDICGRGWIY